jgi:hypothetical protein
VGEPAPAARRLEGLARAVERVVALNIYPLSAGIEDENVEEPGAV